MKLFRLKDGNYPNQKFNGSALLLVVLVLACFALAPLAEAKPGEDRGNGNSAAEHVDALNLGTTGSNNTAHGWSSLFSNTTGLENTADGFQALYSNTSGDSNTAVGLTALHANQSGQGNTAIGQRTLSRNDVTGTGFGSFNTAVGSQALEQNIDGGFNVAVGALAGFGISTGSVNVVVGLDAGAFIDTGSNIIAIGAGVTGVSTGLGEFDDSCYIGNIHGQPIDPAGVPLPVFVDADGKLGNVPSSRRFKKDIKPMDQASEVLLALKPVTFQYNNDKKCTPQFGLIAEDVAKVNPALMLPDKQGKPYTVRYEAVNAMLLNEFLKEHRRVEEQGCKMGALETTIARQQKEFCTTVEQQQKEITALTAALKAQAAQIQNVSEQVRTAKPAARLASNQE